MFGKVSSPINALCRSGNIMGAYTLVRRAKNIREIVNNATANNAMNNLTQEENRIYSDDKERLEMESIGHFNIVPIRSKYHIAGRIAAGLQRSDNYATFIVINTVVKEVSIRGVMAKYIANKLSSIGYLCGGHAKYCACSLLPSQNIEEFILRLRSVIA